jgi:hypothetical protein
MNEEVKPIPVVGEKRLDLSKIATEGDSNKSMSLVDYNRANNINACIACGRGGHTRTTLIKVVLSISTRELGYACKEHAVKYINLQRV